MGMFMISGRRVDGIVHPSAYARTCATTRSAQGVYFILDEKHEWNFTGIEIHK